MKLYEITITPVSGLGTSLKGDTLFGQFCWQVQHDDTLLDGGLDKHVAGYSDKPFAVFSSAWPKLKSDTLLCAVKRPDLPFSKLFKKINARKDNFEKYKENKKKKWLLVNNGFRINLSEENFISDEQLSELLRIDKKSFVINAEQMHNSINRRTGSTGTGQFAPFTKENIWYAPGVQLVVYVLIDESVIDIKSISKGLERIGKFGFGRDASTGLGRFELAGYQTIDMAGFSDANACYTIAPSVPGNESFSKRYLSTFTRYGKHGDYLATGGNPFKNPVIMADEGAVFIPADKTFFKKPYTGSAVTGVSLAMPETIVQGYTPYIPFKLEL